MTHFSPISILSLLLFLSPLARGNDWPGWRGPNHNGVAETQDAPVTLGKPKWSVDIPGRGHGSLSVKGKQVIFVTGEPDGQSVVCADRESGDLLWTTQVHSGGLTQKLNKKATWASGTPAIHDGRIFVNFVNGKSAFTTALDLSGKILWQTELCPYKIHQGYASSPVIYKDLVIVSADNKLGGAVCGLNQANGTIVWKVDRAKKPNYPSPVIFHVKGKEQLFLTGTDKVSSYNPLNGEVIWEVDGSTTECVTTTVTDGERIFSTGGYPKNHVAAISLDGSGKIEWTVPSRVYVPSLLYKDDYLYGIMDAGVAVCWKSDSGEEVWKGRLGGNFSSSPVLVGNQIYAANESGTLVVYKADPAKFEIVAKNEIADEIFATPAICGGEIFLRVAFYESEKRSEKIVCYGK